MIRSIKSVCVYCGSSSNVEDIYKTSAAQLGKNIAEANMKLVYGGGHVGLMGITADSVLENKGEVIGIIPSHIADHEVAHSGLTELHVVESMHERKQMMVDRSDAFIIMPGGLGTMDEFFEIFTWWQLGLHDKPVAIANIAGYWDPLLTLLNNIANENFCRKKDLSYLRIVNSVDEVLKSLTNIEQEEIPPKTKLI